MSFMPPLIERLAGKTAANGALLLVFQEMFFLKFILSPQISVPYKVSAQRTKTFVNLLSFFCNCIMLIFYGSYGYNKCYMREGTLWDSLELAPYLS